jgi:hypothetical protein
MFRELLLDERKLLDLAVLSADFEIFIFDETFYKFKVDPGKLSIENVLSRLSEPAKSIIFNKL